MPLPVMVNTGHSRNSSSNHNSHNSRSYKVFQIPHSLGMPTVVDPTQSRTGAPLPLMVEDAHLGSEVKRSFCFSWFGPKP